MRMSPETFLRTVRQKKPDLILCAWQAPEMLGRVQYSSKGVGAVNETEIAVVDGHPTLSSLSTPSIKLRYQLPPKRTLLPPVVPAGNAQKLFESWMGRWLEKPWMQMFRAFRKRRASDLAKSSASTPVNLSWLLLICSIRERKLRKCPSHLVAPSVRPPAGAGHLTSRPGISLSLYLTYAVVANERRLQGVLTCIENFIRDWCSNDSACLWQREDNIRCNTPTPGAATLLW